ncbi:hypothetical protein BCR32DRAFT_267296 [Anaeromyces robustus]|uniref:Succinate dehydrogenase cytochrome b560 subunit n=1 Tax=Anaeromyces robustus TaxID=1754192 RepID=A0A1Y1XB15_9FUNG|nr:hypothetical protein BCR32DRAFT_267296 [Anaeromyces robustus]|eukprot:ORX82913.1 hypothetical protein BCR32DRAFT_267296 [Anaeromyces robustus]
MFLSLQNKIFPKAIKITPSPVNSLSCILNNNNVHSKFIVLNTSLNSRVILNQPLRNYVTENENKKNDNNNKEKLSQQQKNTKIGFFHKKPKEVFRFTDPRVEQMRIDLEKRTVWRDPYEKAKKLGRPISPKSTMSSKQHIYSLIHRTIGVILCTGFTVIALTYPFMNYQWSSVVQYLSTLSPRTALIGKIIIGTPLSYYTLTLFKKLIWESTKGFNKNFIRKTDRLTFYASLILAAALAGFL